MPSFKSLRTLPQPFFFSFSPPPSNPFQSRDCSLFEGGGLYLFTLLTGRGDFDLVSFVPSSQIEQLQNATQGNHSESALRP